MRLSSVVLPDPEGPAMARNAPPSTLQADTAKGRDLGAAAAIHFGHVVHRYHEVPSMRVRAAAMRSVRTPRLKTQQHYTHGATARYDTRRLRGATESRTGHLVDANPRDAGVWYVRVERTGCRLATDRDVVFGRDGVATATAARAKPISSIRPASLPDRPQSSGNRQGRLRSSAVQPSAAAKLQAIVDAARGRRMIRSTPCCSAAAFEVLRGPY